MFADISGFTSLSETLDHEDVRTLADGCAEIMGEQVRNFGGTVVSVMGDAVMAVFGAPVAHEDDPERAVRAAFAMRDAVAASDLSPVPLQVHAGVNTGDVMAGAVGPKDRRKRARPVHEPVLPRSSLLRLRYLRSSRFGQYLDALGDGRSRDDRRARVPRGTLGHMPFATNARDGVRTYFEVERSDGTPVLVYAGFTDPLEYARSLPLVARLADRYRLILADHRGQGRSEKPHEVAAYNLETRVQDAVAVLDALDIPRAHLIGFSWGARLGFATGEYAPDRILSLVLIGNQPYEWDLSSPTARGVAHAGEALTDGGVPAFLERWESAIGSPFPEQIRTWILENDPVAIEAAWRSVKEEGPVSTSLDRWTVPCLISIGERDEMFESARRAASEIPRARFVVLPEQTHFSAEGAADDLLPHVLTLFGGDET